MSLDTLAGLLTEAQPIMARVARTVGQQFTGYIEQADLMQDLAVWTCENEDRVREWLTPVDADDDSREGRRKLHTTYRRMARGIAHQAKADRLGYRVEDLHFYSKATVEELLPVVFADYDEWLDATPQEGPKPKTDPALGNNKLALLCDVKAAYLSGSGADRTLLMDRYGAGTDIDVLAADAAVDESTIRRRIDRALGRMVERLGGTRPDFGVKSRRDVMSNEAAQRLTSNQEGS